MRWNADILVAGMGLAYVSWYGHLDIARLLIEHNAGVDIRDEKHQTPLTYASWNGPLDIARLLIKHDAEVDSQDENHLTPLAYASWNGHLDIARLLIKHGAEVDQPGRGSSDSIDLRIMERAPRHLSPLNRTRCRGSTVGRRII